MSEACPECRGVARAMSRHSAPFQVFFDPEYLDWIEGHTSSFATWNKTFYVCAGCCGIGTREAWSARVLSGDFDPNKPGQPQGPATGDPAQTLKLVAA